MAICPNPGQRSIYRAGPGGNIPHSIYLYYVDGFPATPQSIRAYFYHHPDAIESVAEILQILTTPDSYTGLTLLANACDDLDWPPKAGYGFAAVKRRKRSYMVVVLADPQHTLVECDAVRIVAGGQYADNYCYFDGIDWGDFQFTNSEGDQISASAVSFINHMHKDDIGGDLEIGEEQHHKFKIRGALRGSLAPVVEFEDSGGTNLGPPVPPPAFFTPH